LDGFFTVASREGAFNFSRTYKQKRPAALFRQGALN
jgi:hypothetical protein